MAVESSSIKRDWDIVAKGIWDRCMVSNGGILGRNMGRAMMIIEEKGWIS